MYPKIRMRRNRSKLYLRQMLAETNIFVDDLILPIFISGNSGIEEIKSMPGIKRYGLDVLPKLIEEISHFRIKSVALFPDTPSQLKDEKATEALNSDNLVCRAIKIIKNIDDKLIVIADIALDPYTIHGHDGIINDKEEIDNDRTLEMLGAQALNFVEAGCDILAPSDMMDGRIGFIRDILEKEHYHNINILSYAVKYASSLYGPFREAINTKINFGQKDKKTYQMDYRNKKESIMEAELDIMEGADILMVKPAIFYLDIIKTLSEQFVVPIFAYQVSGEYSMMRAASDNNWLDYSQLLMESLISIKRAGAKAIFTYAALDVAKILSEAN